VSIIELKDAKGKVDLFRHKVTVSRKITYIQKDDVIIVTSCEKLTEDHFEEFWDQIDVDDLAMEGWSFNEEDHKEVVTSSEAFQRRCPFTVDMFRGSADAGRLK
jgi:hypothetical protein